MADCGGDSRSPCGHHSSETTHCHTRHSTSHHTPSTHNSSAYAFEAFTPVGSSNRSRYRKRHASETISPQQARLLQEQKERKNREQLEKKEQKKQKRKNRRKKLLNKAKAVTKISQHS
jgi:hypothetical protein